MRFKEDIKPIADLENKAAHLLRQVNESRRPVVITEGRGLP
jgi:prevent-host-death family protein